MKLSTVPSSFLLTLATVTGSLAAPADNDGLYVRADCTFNAGQTGTCMTTTTCAQQGGTSEAGHCPGAANIQCCTLQPVCPAPAISGAAVDFIKKQEGGFQANSYPDAGRWSIGC